MSIIRIYHNPNFLDYQGDHAAIVLPHAPIASVTLPADISPDQALSWSFGRTQHLEHHWWSNRGVLLHVRSTSVGDVLENADGRRFVVESAGFQPYESPVGETIRPRDVPVAWEDAQAGDSVTRVDQTFLVVARKLDRKWRARRLARRIPNAQLWHDDPRHWAVILPVEGG
jgi:hypothetical protein